VCTDSWENVLNEFLTTFQKVVGEPLSFYHDDAHWEDLPLGILIFSLFV